MKLRRRAGSILLAALLSAAGLQAGVEARTENFRILTAQPPAVARAAAERLEQVRLWFDLLELPAAPEREPIWVLIFGEAAEIRPFLRPGRFREHARAQHLAGTDRTIITVAWNAPGSPLGAVTHEYAHHVFRGERLPMWLNEGIAEYLATLRRTGESLEAGAPNEGHLERLRTHPWIPLQKVFQARRNSDLQAAPVFYPQCWLLVHWLLSQRAEWQGLQPRKLQALAAEWDAEQLERRLRDYAAAPLPVFQTPLDSGPEPQTEMRPLEAWEWPWAVAELYRELRMVHEAAWRLKALRMRNPQPPEPSESLGALEMDRKRYGAAERHLRAAVSLGSRNPRTHYRYSLVLMLPSPGRTLERARLAARHAARARELHPGEPLYVLAEAQARTVAENWETAAEALAVLRRFPGWRKRADVEFAELIRRRQQVLRAIPPPRVNRRRRPPELHLAWGPETPPGPPPAPRPARVRQSWPPPGTVLLYGYITYVECSSEGKIVTVRSPRFQVRLRERRGSPARLLSAPKWRDPLACGVQSWEVNVAYRPRRDEPGIRGDLVAVVF